ncbi:MAG TPA: histidine kinase [Clostridiaceae bacterium]|nr:histidine kinase [Clostridiaceae bacterium]
MKKYLTSCKINSALQFHQYWQNGCGDVQVNFSFLYSVKYKYLFTTLVLIFFFAFIVIYLWYSGASSYAEKSAVTFVSGALKTSNDNFEIALKDINQIVSYAAVNEENVISVLSGSQEKSSRDILADNRKIETYLLSLFGFHYYLSQIMVADLEGRYYNVGITLPYTDLKEQSWYNDVLNSDGDKPTIILPHYVNDNYTSTRSLVFSIAKPVISNFRVIGIIIADIKFSIFDDIFSSSLENSGTVLMVDNLTGKVIYRSDSQNTGFSPDERDLQIIANGLGPGSGNFSTVIGQESVLVVYNHLAFTNWTTIGIIPKDSLMSNFNKTRNTALLVSLLFCILVMTMSFLTSSLLTRNLLKLNKAMKNIDRDNLDISINIDTKDEIGQLYRQFNSMVLRIKSLIADIKKTENEKRKSEIKALQAQINPHFLYNTLNTIKFLAVMQRAENIKNVSESLLSLLFITMSEKSFITVEDEIKYITSYLNIQKYKYSGKFIYNVSVEEDTCKYMLPKLLLQPIVENSLIHGIAPLNSQGIISIRIYRDENMLKLLVRDNGCGMDEEKIRLILDNKIQSAGIGIYNVISRIKLYFGEEYGVTIQSEPFVNTTLEIAIPLISEDKVDKYV